MLRKLSTEEAFSLTRPMIYTLVTCLDKDGKPNAIGVSWATRTSIKPMMMLVSIAFNRYSHECIEHCKEFVVNYPNEEQAKGAWLCGVESGREQDKIAKAGLKLVDSDVVKVPTIEDVTAAFECKLSGQFITGDHTVFFGEVVAIRGNPDKSMHLYVNGNFDLCSIDNNLNVNKNVAKK